MLYLKIYITKIKFLLSLINVNTLYLACYVAVRFKLLHQSQGVSGPENNFSLCNNWNKHFLNSRYSFYTENLLNRNLRYADVCEHA